MVKATQAWPFAQVWNASLDTNRQRPLEPREHVWASEIGGSLYDRYWKMKGRQATTPPNLRSRRKFEAGNLTEWVIRQVLIRSGVMREEQTHLADDSGVIKVTGRLDFLGGGEIRPVHLDDLPESFAMVAEAAIEALQERYPSGLREQILEIKSCSAIIFNKYEREPGLHHALQAYFYATTRDLPAHIIYVCRDDLRICEWVIMPEAKKWKQIYDADLIAIAEALKLPESEAATLKEPLLLWDEKEGKFNKNYKVEYSLYLTDYGYERPDEYAEPTSKLCGRLNRVVTRIKERKPMTAKNLEAIDDGVKFDPRVADIFERLKRQPSLL